MWGDSRVWGKGVVVVVVVVRKKGLSREELFL